MCLVNGVCVCLNEVGLCGVRLWLTIVCWHGWDLWSCVYCAGSVVLGVVCVSGHGVLCIVCGFEWMLWPLCGRRPLDFSLVLCCDVSSFGGHGVGQGCECDVPGLIMVLWCGILCFEGFCRWCCCLESSVWGDFGWSWGVWWYTYGC